MATKYYYSQASGANNGTSESDAYTDLQTALNALSAGDHLYCKRHSSREGAKTTNLTLTTDSEAAAGNTVVEGYGTTPGDGVLYQTASPVNFAGDGITVKYFDIDSDDDASTTLYLNGDSSLAYRCKVTSSYAFGTCLDLIDASAVECVAKSTVTNASDYVIKSNRAHIINCTAIIDAASGSAGSAINVGVGFRTNSVVGCLCINEDAAESHVGIFMDGNNGGGNLISNNTVYNMAIGIEHDDGPVAARVNIPTIVFGNLIYSCGNGIVNSQGTNTVNFALMAMQNAFGAITSNQISNFGYASDSVTLTESPFVDTTNFEINNAPGGGALLKGVLNWPVDPRDLDSTVRKQFGTYGAIQPNPVGEVSRSF